MQKVRFINYAKDYLRFKKEYDAAWKRINRLGELILRKDIEEFEQRLADYIGTKYAVALSSGTDAIYLSIKALGVKAGSTTFKNVTSLVAGHMGPGTNFDGLTPCDSGYVSAVNAYADANGAIPKK